MSPKYEMVKEFYDRKTWTANMVRNAVVKNWITAEEFFLITGLEYITTE